MADAEVIRIADRTRKQAPEASEERPRCAATTTSGRPCRNLAIDERGYCRVHAGDLATQAPKSEHAGRDERSRQGSGTTGGDAGSDLAEFVRRRLAGNYPIDDFGYDPELSREILLPLVKQLYERYFRVRTLGVDRIPVTGPALLVANHSGTIPLDAVMVGYAVATEHPAKRVVRNVAANLAFQVPFFGPLARKGGAAVANDDDARELLRRGEIVGVFPEGYKGVGKGWRERYRLQRFGRGGFMELALKTRVPIIPCAVVGAEEAYPMIANLKLVAKAFGFPYFPVTPTFPLLGPLGLLPLPSRWLIEFGEPISTEGYPDDPDAMLIFDLADQVRDTIQQMIHRNLKIRGGAFF